ncbi:TetR/AcrR family transcriptional regulator [Geomonas sp. Red875]|uniref:TetR/AcrR family transcriptional regulator n=1 Tax=Geomesophilobacter sediminis TaxID=2798584 RepID=A0A8J7JBH3_9BACT|nr:TetR/AcrR family transcriptional regulator [Geomesophilobacter sediminis]
MEKGDKRCAIIRATLELVAEHGFHGAPMAAVAERAGVAAGTIYRYFESKDVLIQEIYHFLEDRFFQGLMIGYPEGQPARERFLHIGKFLVHYCMENPLQARFLEQFHNSPYGIAHRRDKFYGTQDKDVIYELFADAVATGTVKQLPLTVLFSLTFSPLRDICRDHYLNFTMLDDDLIARCVEACWDAVRK